MPQLPASSHCAFLALPPEIRLEVYGHCIPERICFGYIFNTWYISNTSANIHWKSMADWYSQKDGQDATHGQYRLLELEDYFPDPSEPEDDDACLFDPTVTVKGFSSPHSIRQLLLVCHQITSEAKPVLYRKTTSMVNTCILKGHSPAALFNPEMRQQIHKLTLVLQHTDTYHAYNFSSDSVFWDAFLPNLSVVGTIVAKLDKFGDWP